MSRPGAFDSLECDAWAGRAGEGTESLKKGAPKAASEVIKDALQKIGS